MVQLSHYEPFTTFIFPALVVIGGLCIYMAAGPAVRSTTKKVALVVVGAVTMIVSVIGTTTMNSAEHTANMDAIKSHYQISEVHTLKDGKPLEKIRAEDHEDYLVTFDPTGDDKHVEGVISVSKNGTAALLIAEGEVFSDYNQVTGQPTE
jgi:hypothetical protein